MIQTKGVDMQVIKIFVITIVLITFSIPTSEAKSTRVKSSITKTGTYRSPHLRTSPNKTKIDNWSTKGNVNPFTGQKGTKNP
jgi:hypothetical protein